VLAEDLANKSVDLARQIVDTLPVSVQHDIEQSYFRGKIKAYEEILGIGEDLKNWQAALKGE
jgi:hypothetical protein